MLARFKQVLLSPASLAIYSFQGIAAGIGGLALTIPALFGLSFKNSRQTTAASFGPMISLFTLGLNYYVKKNYLHRALNQMSIDQERITNAIDNLKKTSLENSLREKFPQSYLTILESCREKGFDMQVTHIASLDVNKLSERYGHTTCFELTIKAISTSIDLFSNGISGMSAILLNFLIPVILKDMEEEQIEDLLEIALPLSLLYAAYAAITSLALSTEQWIEVKHKKEAIVASLGTYQTLYSELKQDPLNKPDSTSSYRVMV